MAVTRLAKKYLAIARQKYACTVGYLFRNIYIYFLVSFDLKMAQLACSSWRNKWFSFLVDCGEGDVEN